MGEGVGVAMDNAYHSIQRTSMKTGAAFSGTRTKPYEAGAVAVAVFVLLAMLEDRYPWHPGNN